MGGKAQRREDLKQARELREQREAEKKRAAMRMLRNDWTVEATAKAVRACEATVQKWKKELGNE